MLASACGGNPSDSPDAGSTPDMAAVVNPCTSGPFCATSAIADGTVELLASGSSTFNVTSNPGYTGKIVASVQRSAIDSKAGGTDPFVGIVVVPGEFQADSSKVQKLSVNFNTQSDAAAFTAETIMIHLQDSADATKSIDVPFKLTVTPTLTVTLSNNGVGATPHTWSTDSLTGVGGTTPIRIRNRPTMTTGGVTTGGTNFVIFNSDTNIHTIHGSGVIPHQSTVAGQGTQPQGTYVQNNKNVLPTATQNTGFYCHDHSQNDRNIVFVP